jgi:hypothetical protein
MVLRFNKKIYPLTALRKAIRDWRQLAGFKLVNSKNYFLVKVSDKEKGLADEFVNYVLSAMKDYPEINEGVR